MRYGFILICVCALYLHINGQARFTLNDFYSENNELANVVDSAFEKLTDKEKAAQLIMYAVSSTDNVYTFTKTKKLLQDTIISNVVFLKGHLDVIKNQINQFDSMQRNLQNLYACDCEPSLFNMKYFGSSKVPKTNLLIYDSLLRQYTDTIIATLRRTGIQINFAPVVDKAFNTAVINNRSFGKNDSAIIHLSNQFISQTQEQQIATSIKHFPGHGNVTGDSHKNLVYIDGALKEIQNFDSVYQASKPIFTMVGHIAVKNNQDWNTFNEPSTISANIVNGLLKNKLQFKGIAVTDAMNMLGVATIPDADFKALKAGIDLVLMPVNPRKLHQQILDEMKKDSFLSKQINASIKKIIRLKLCLTE